ncbi:hypothetical protein R3Q56_006733 [Pseudomonas aeruginosa]|nr:hypothetical protein [Pseudomonas aeruginosa]ELR2942361.1 hypothetical protein [Pseudomonas aeruginosa]
MARIKEPEIGQMIWTVANGQICQRIYAGPSKLYNGHVLEVPGYSGQATYYVDHLFAYEQESDILHLQLESAREAVSQAKQRLASLEIRYREALMKEQSWIADTNTEEAANV